MRKYAPRLYRVLVRSFTVKFLFASLFATWSLATPTPARADANFIASPGASDTLVGSSLEDLIGFKLASEGTTLTAAQTSNLPALLQYGTAELAIEEAEVAPALITAGPIGWLALAAGTGYLVSNALFTTSVTTDPSYAWNCLTTFKCGDGSAIPNGPNIAAGQPYWSTTAADGGTGKTYSGYGSTPDDAMTAALSNANSADSKLAGSELSCTEPTPTSASCSYQTYYNKPSSTTNTVSYNASAPASCTSSQASSLTSSGCTSLTAQPLPQEYSPPQGQEFRVPSDEAPNQMSPQLEANLANKIWEYGVQDPNIEFPAPLPNDPITPADVEHEQAQNPNLPAPKAPDTLAPPITVPSTGTPSTWTPQQFNPAPEPTPSPATPGTSTNPTTSTPTTTTTSTGTGTGTGTTGTGTSTGTGTGTSTGTGTGTASTSGSNLPPCGNLAAGEPSCEVDWNPTSAPAPTAPADSNYSDIFQSLLTFAGVSFWKSWSVSIPAGQCQAFPMTLPLLNQTYTLDWCAPLESMRSLQSTVEHALMAVVVVVTLLGA